ncbi:MAG: hypothetical protein OXD40_04445 [bacterium]|nr:hypothetical protein [bacterium]
MNDHLARIIAVELPAAARGSECRRPLRTSEMLARAPFRDEGRLMAPDIEAVSPMVPGGTLAEPVATALD